MAQKPQPPDPVLCPPMPETPSQGPFQEGGVFTTHDRLQARDVLVVSPSGNRCIRILAQDSCVGLWMGDALAQEPLAAVWLNERGIGLGGYQPGAPVSPANVCLGLTPQGEPFLQMSDPRTHETLFLTFDHLKAILGMLGERRGPG